MTINSQLCARFNTSSKSFIKSCDQYSVTGFTSTSHTSSYKQHKPVNKMPKSGRASVTLSAKLGSADSGSVGSANRGWLPTKLDKYSIPDPHQIQTTTENASLIAAEVAELLFKVAVVETRLSPDSYVSKIFLVEKKDGGQRPVINLKDLNQFVKQEHFKMEGLHLLPDLLQPGDWMTKMDLKDAYLQVPIHSSHQTLLTFLWEEKYFKYHLAWHQHREFYIFGRSVDCTSKQGPTTADDSINLPTFWMFGPNSQSEEICFTTNSKAGISGFRDLHPANDPQEKMRKIQQDACRLLTKSQVSVRELAQFVGKATATIRALPTAPLHYRAQQFLMNSVHPTEDNLQEGVTTTKFNTVVQLNLTSKSDLQWWISLDRKSLSTPITFPAPSGTIESDASNKGWGAVLNGQTRTGGIWSVQE